MFCYAQMGRTMAVPRKTPHNKSQALQKLFQLKKKDHFDLEQRLFILVNFFFLCWQ